MRVTGRFVNGHWKLPARPFFNETKTTMSKLWRADGGKNEQCKGGEEKTDKARESKINEKEKKERKEKSFTEGELRYLLSSSCRDPGYTTERMQSDQLSPVQMLPARPSRGFSFSFMEWNTSKTSVCYQMLRLSIFSEKICTLHNITNITKYHYRIILYIVIDVSFIVSYYAILWYSLPFLYSIYFIAL